MKILLVEDDDLDASEIEQAIRYRQTDAKIALERATCLRAASEFLRCNPCDVVVLDLGLPDSCGMDSVKAIREVAPDAAVVVLTGHEDEATAVDALNAGAQDFVTKTELSPLGLQRALRFSRERMEIHRRLHESRRFFKAVLDAMPAHVCVIDRACNIVAVNEAWRKLAQDRPELNHCSREEPLSYRALCAPETGICPGNVADLEAAFDRLFAGDLNAHHVEYPLGEGEQTRWFRLTATRFAGPGPAHAVVAHEDITQRKQLEHKLLQHQRMEGIGSLACGIAHDLNNLLAPMMMSTDLLRDGLPPGELRETVETIDHGARRGAKIVKQLLAFGRGVEGRLGEMRPDTFLSEVRQTVASILPANVELVSELDPAAPGFRGDAEQLHQVLRELVQNACDAMPEGGCLTLRGDAFEVQAGDRATDLSARPGRYFRIEVRDTGRGIEADRCEQIFEPFHTTKPIGEGTGLGLSTVMGIVRSHEGFIEVSSRPGTETVFAVHLPAVESPVAAWDGPEETDDDSESAAAYVDPPSRPAWDLSGFTVLVVDDDKGVRQLLRKILTRAGAEVLSAENGQAGLEIVRERIGSLSLIISDFDMPVMDGYEFILQLRSMGCDCRVLISTGKEHHPQEAVIRSELGVHEFLLKPYEAATLLERVANEDSAARAVELA